MTDETNKPIKIKTPEEHKAEIAEKAIVKLAAVKAAKKLKNPDSNWSLVQEILQEILASHKVANPDKIPKTPQLKEELEKEISKRYEDEPETRTLLLEAVPSERSIREWFKKSGWDEAVWDFIRKSGLFTAQKRAELINALFQRGVDRDTQAAKIWLTLSGDYVEKSEVNDKTTDTYREIQKAILANKEDE